MSGLPILRPPQQRRHEIQETALRRLRLTGIEAIDHLVPGWGLARLYRVARIWLHGPRSYAFLGVFLHLDEGPPSAALIAEDWRCTPEDIGRPLPVPRVHWLVASGVERVRDWLSRVPALELRRPSRVWTDRIGCEVGFETERESRWLEFSPRSDFVEGLDSWYQEGVGLRDLEREGPRAGDWRFVWQRSLLAVEPCPVESVEWTMEEMYPLQDAPDD